MNSPITRDSPLYIYYLEGRPDTRPLLKSPAFIGNWQEDDSAFLFFTQSALQQVQTLTAHQEGLRLLDQFQMSYQEWQGGCLDTLEIGCFRIYPPEQADNHTAAFSAKSCGAAPDPPSGAFISFTLDPGLVFGNGLHPTTQNCLVALEQAWKRFAIKRMLDLGTGTGVLALAAAGLGCRRILAVDLNLLAVQTTRRNIAINQFQNRILTVQGRAEELAAVPADLLVANLHFDAMQRLLNTQGIQDKAALILSGLLRSEVGQVKDILQRQQVILLEEWQQDGIWHTLLAARKE